MATGFDVQIPKAADALAKDAETMLTLAREFKIGTAADYAMAADTLKRVKSKRDALEALRVDLKKPIIEAGRNVDNKFKPWIAYLDDTERLYKHHMIVYDDEQELARQAQQRKLDEQAARERAKLEKKGKHEQAAAVVAPVVASARVDVVGISRRVTWRAECDDIVALCRAVADGKVAPLAVEANMKFLHKQAEALHEHFAIPGCRAVEEKGIAASSRRG